MPATRIVVVGPSRALGTVLERRLSPSRFEVIDVQPGRGMFDAICRDRPGIAVIDRIDERPESARLEIAVLKEFWPGVEIIAFSLHSTETDASIVEEGVFYYAGSASVDELIRVIYAAEQAVSAAMEPG